MQVSWSRAFCWALVALIFCQCCATLVLAEDYTVMCSGGGIRAATGCSLALTTLKAHDATFYGNIKVFKGISGGAWGISMLALRPDRTTIETTATTFASKFSQWGPQVFGGKVSRHFYNGWKKQIAKYFIKPFDKTVKTLTNLQTKVTATHGAGVVFEIVVAGVNLQSYGDPLGYCIINTGDLRIKCYDSTTGALAWETDASTQKFSQLLSLSSSAASTLELPGWLRKFPRFNFGKSATNAALPYKFLIDAGNFNNLPFIPAATHEKVITFDFTDDTDGPKAGTHKDPFQCYSRFVAWVGKNGGLTNEALDADVLILRSDGSFVKQNDLAKHPPQDAVLFIFRAQHTHGGPRYYYNIPFTGLTKQFSLIESFPTMTSSFGIVIKDYTKKEMALFVSEYVNFVQTHAKLIVDTIKAVPTTLPWGTATVFNGALLEEDALVSNRLTLALRQTNDQPFANEYAELPLSFFGVTDSDDLDDNDEEEATPPPPPGPSASPLMSNPPPKRSFS